MPLAPGEAQLERGAGDVEDAARLAGVRIPLIPGIMPMTSLKRVKRMGELSGLEVPEGVEKQLRDAADGLLDPTDLALHPAPDSEESR